MLVAKFSGSVRQSSDMARLTLNEGMHTLHLVNFFFFILCVSTLTSLGHDVAKSSYFSSAGACDYVFVRTRRQTLIVRQNDSISRRWKQALVSRTTDKRGTYRGSSHVQPPHAWTDGRRRLNDVMKSISWCLERPCRNHQLSWPKL